jgi:hypothetical protein
MTIKLNKDQVNKFKKWQKSFGKLPHIGATGGHFGLKIIFTSIGEVIYGISWDGKEIDLTDDEDLT